MLKTWPGQHFASPSATVYPLEWQQTVAEIQRRVDIVRSTRATSASTATEDPQSNLDREQAKAKRLALIIIGRLSQTVTKMLQAAIIEDDYFNPVVIYRWLRANFGMSDEAKRQLTNPETIVLEILSKRWTNGTFLSFAQFVQRQFQTAKLSPKLSDSSVQNLREANDI